MEAHKGRVEEATVGEKIEPSRPLEKITDEGEMPG